MRSFLWSACPHSCLPKVSFIALPLMLFWAAELKEYIRENIIDKVVIFFKIRSRIDWGYYYLVHKCCVKRNLLTYILLYIRSHFHQIHCVGFFVVGGGGGFLLLFFFWLVFLNCIIMCACISMHDLWWQMSHALQHILLCSSM